MCIKCLIQNRNITIKINVIITTTCKKKLNASVNSKSVYSKRKHWYVKHSFLGHKIKLIDIWNNFVLRKRDVMIIQSFTNCSMNFIMEIEWQSIKCLKTNLESLLTVNIWYCLIDLSLFNIYDGFSKLLLLELCRYIKNNLNCN